MFKTALAYILAPLIVGWGSGLFALPFIAIPALFGQGGFRNLAKTATSITNGVATGVATYAVKWLCDWLDVQASYTMYAIPLILLIQTDLDRIRRIMTAPHYAGVDFDLHPEKRQEIINENTMDLWADLIGFAIAVLLLSPLPLY